MDGELSLTTSSGSTAAYCGTGCQPGFGSCTGTNPPTTTSKSIPPTSTPTAATLSDCLAKKNVPIRLTSSSDFGALAKPYNLRLPYTPAVIVLPTTTRHVSDAVVCAGQNNVKVQARSGGHSYASFSLGGQSGSMVIDLESFQTIKVDANKVATVGGGVRLGNLALGIYNQSQRALPHGTCPGVGVGGHATHGGFGYSSRAWGLTLDTIVGLEVILANGSCIHATSTSYPDIYYALRGAADSFGIVTSFHLQTQPAPSVVQWSYSIPNMFQSGSQSAKYFSHIQAFAQNASVVDRNLGMGMYMDGSGFSIHGTYFGSLSTFNTKIAPELLRTLPAPTQSSAQTVTWIQSLTALAEPQPLQQPTTGYDLHDDFFAKSLVVPSAQPLTQAALTAYFDYMIQNGVNAPNPWFSIINLYGGPDSQINTRPASFSSAYSDRSALWVLQHYGYTGNTGSPFPQGITSFIEGLSGSITKAQPGTVFPGYANYVDPSLTAAQAHAAYFDEATYGRLLGIKGQVDPGKVFWNPQAVGN
ncbi:MAG: hypothetical protein Q9202_006293 [Teloschistes flavicans]